MELKPQLLVFNKKEIFIIVLLLVLVAMFSFTLGIRLGKKLAISHPNVVETPPFTAAQPEHSSPEHEEGAENTDPHSEAYSHAQESSKELSKEPGKEAQKKAENSPAEKTADSEFAEEVKKEKVTPEKSMPMHFPKNKKAELESVESKYTLQVGSYRTVAEAAEQVTQLKHEGLDAFYLEASVPGKGTWYRVGIGIFPTKDQAEKAAQKWKTEKQLPHFLIQKIGD